MAPYATGFEMWVELCFGRPTVRIQKIGFVILGAATIANAVAAQPASSPPTTNRVRRENCRLSGPTALLFSESLLSVTIPVGRERGSCLTADGHSSTTRCSGSTKFSR